MASNWKHLVQYYETDLAGIVHHSNYVRWFEEARTWMMSDMGYDYAKMEADGVLVPVLAITAQYKRMTRFGETVTIAAKVEQFNGVTMTLSYEVTDVATGKVKAIGSSMHAFLDKESYRPIALKRSLPAVHDIFAARFETDQTDVKDGDSIKSTRRARQSIPEFDFTTPSSVSTLHKVQVYETDQMAIVHHSNFIRLFEEARTELMAHIGFTEKEQAELGVLAALVKLRADYKTMIRFGESVTIQAKISGVEGNQIHIAYQILDLASGELRSVGQTTLQAIDLGGDRSFKLADALPDLYAKLEALAAE